MNTVERHSNGLKAAWESGDRAPASADLHEQLATALDDRRRVKALLGAARGRLTAVFERAAPATGCDNQWRVNWAAWERAVVECDRHARELAETERDVRTLCARIALRF